MNRSVSSSLEETRTVDSGSRQTVQAYINALAGEDGLLSRLQTLEATEQDLNKRFQQLTHNTEAALKQCATTKNASAENLSWIQSILDRLDNEGSDDTNYADEKRNCQRLVFDFEFRHQTAELAHKMAVNLKQETKKKIETVELKKNECTATIKSHFSDLYSQAEHVSDQNMKDLINRCGFSKDTRRQFLKFVKDELKRDDLAPEDRTRFLRHLIDLPASWRAVRPQAHQIVAAHIDNTWAFSSLPLSEPKWSSMRNDLKAQLAFAKGWTALGEALEEYRDAVSTSAQRHRAHNKGAHIQGLAGLLNRDKEKLDRLNKAFDEIVSAQAERWLESTDDLVEYSDDVVKLMYDIVLTTKSIENQENHIERARIAPQTTSDATSASELEEKVRAAVGNMQHLLVTIPNSEWKKSVLPKLEGNTTAETAFVEAINNELAKESATVISTRGAEYSETMDKLVHLLTEAHITWTADGASLAGRALAPYLVGRPSQIAVSQTKQEMLGSLWADACNRRVDFAIRQVQQNRDNPDPLMQEATYKLIRAELSGGSGLERMKGFLRHVCEQAFNARTEFIEYAKCYFLKPDDNEGTMAKAVEELLDDYASGIKSRKKREEEKQVVRDTLDILTKVMKGVASRSDAGAA